jgi:hypothetical protein
LPPVTRLWQASVLYVVFEIEMLVVNPVGKIELKRNAFEAALEQRTHVQPLLDVREYVLEADNLAAGYGRRVEDCDTCYLDVIVFRFHVKELGVLWA